MRLVTTMLSNTEINDELVHILTKAFKETFNCKSKTYKFRFDDRKYYEVDIDLFDVEFSINTIYRDIDRLISIYERILETAEISIDFIAGNDDTETEVLKYEKDNEDIQTFGLFVTKRAIPNLKPYYSSKTCNAYVNLDYVSFGIYP